MKKPKHINESVNNLRKSDVVGLMAFWSLDSFRKLGRAAKSLKKLEGYLREKLPSAKSLYSSNEDGIWLSFWHLLYPEKFEVRTEQWENETFIHWDLKEPFTPRDRAVVQALLMSPQGRALFWKAGLQDTELEWSRKNEVFWQIGEEAFRSDSGEEILLCERCVEPFVPSRKGQKFCSDKCRRMVHSVDPNQRKDYYRVYRFFQRALKTDYRSKAWERTREKHRKTLEALGIDGEKPPAQWHSHSR